jgi:hypothetical protein
MTPSGMRGVPKEVSSIYFADAPPAGGFVARRDKLPYPFEDRGEQRVKNIARPVRVYALRPAAIADLPAAGPGARVNLAPDRCTAPVDPRSALRQQRGTEGSNPSLSTGESIANRTSSTTAKGVRLSSFRACRFVLCHLTLFYYD